MPDNGLNPQWSQVNFACAVWSPEQTLLKVSIYNSKSSLLGKGSKVLLAYAMVPVCALRDGFRSLQLRSPHGCPIEACTLFVHLALTLTLTLTLTLRTRTRARARARAATVMTLTTWSRRLVPNPNPDARGRVVRPPRWHHRCSLGGPIGAGTRGLVIPPAKRSRCVRAAGPWRRQACEHIIAEGGARTRPRVQRRHAC